MRRPCIPSRLLLIIVAAGTAIALAAVITGIDLGKVIDFAWIALSGLAALAAADYFYTVRAWKQAAPTIIRHLPAAFAVGVERRVQLDVTLTGNLDWECVLYDHTDATLLTQGLPISLTLQANKSIECFYAVRPSRRGEIDFAPAAIRLRSRLGLWELTDRIGAAQSRRVYPDFAQVSRYAWLAGDRRLAQIGIKAYRQRGEGTDFKQLSEYNVGDSVRHIDWKASLRFEKPIVR